MFSEGFPGTVPQGLPGDCLLLRTFQLKKSVAQRVLSHKKVSVDGERIKDVRTGTGTSVHMGIGKREIHCHSLSSK